MSNNGKIIRIDQSVTDTYDNTTRLYYLLTEREAAILLSQVEYFKWGTRWENLTYSEKELKEITAQIADFLMNPQEGTNMSCTDVENCLDTSTIINNIETNITNNSTTITNVQNTTNQNSQSISQLEESGAQNVYPPQPDVTNPSEESGACGASWYVAEQLSGLIQDTYNDSQTLTLPQFLTNILVTFGWAIQPLIDLFTDFLTGKSANFIVDVVAAEAEVAEYIYCNNLDVTTGIADFQTNGTASQEVKDAYADTLLCVLPATINTWIVIGSQDTTRNCSTFNCTQLNWRYTWSGSNLANWNENTGNATFDGTKWIGLSDNGGLGRTVQLFKNNQSFNFYRFEGFFRARASRTSGTDGLDLLYQDENTASVFSQKYNTNNFLFEGYWGFNDSQAIRTVNGNLVMTANVAAAVANDPNCISEITEIVIEGFGVAPTLDGTLTYL